MNLQEIITAKVPGAVYTEAGDGMFTIPVEQFHDLARYLHDDPALRFDFLRSLTGMDWGEEGGLGVIYHLESTATGKRVALKTATTDREHPYLPTVSDLWDIANIYEREVYDFYGIIFTGHPDMRRIFMREDWVGFPFRKDSNPGTLLYAGSRRHGASQRDADLRRRRLRGEPRSAAPFDSRRAPLPHQAGGRDD